MLQDDYGNAVEYLELALKIRLKSLGPSHPDVTGTREFIESPKVLMSYTIIPK